MRATNDYCGEVTDERTCAYGFQGRIQTPVESPAGVWPAAACSTVRCVDAGACRWPQEVQRQSINKEEMDAG